jgi:hypothetical protein
MTDSPTPNEDAIAASVDDAQGTPIGEQDDSRLYAEPQGGPEPSAEAAKHYYDVHLHHLLRALSIAEQSAVISALDAFAAEAVAAASAKPAASDPTLDRIVGSILDAYELAPNDEDEKREAVARQIAHALAEARREAAAQERERCLLAVQKVLANNGTRETAIDAIRNLP